MAVVSYDGVETRKARDANSGNRQRIVQAESPASRLCRRSDQNGVPPNIVQRWLDHARIETTAIYAGAIGEEERNLARRAWKSLEGLIVPEKPVSDPLGAQDAVMRSREVGVLSRRKLPVGTI